MVGRILYLIFAALRETVFHFHAKTPSIDYEMQVAWEDPDKTISSGVTHRSPKKGRCWRRRRWASPNSPRVNPERNASDLPTNFVDPFLFFAALRDTDLWSRQDAKY